MNPAAGIISEPAGLSAHANSALGLGILVALYFFGIWSRSYVLPSKTKLPVTKQLIGGIPVGLLTMGMYAKTTFPGLTIATTDLVPNLAIMAGYAIIFGMLSRESLEKLLDEKTGILKPRTG